jgi:hypothetical protein
MYQTGRSRVLGAVNEPRKDDRVAPAAAISPPAGESAELPTATRPALTATSWDGDASMSVSEWTAHGRRLGVVGRGVGWWLGDWLRFGNAAYGERYGPAARITGYDKQSLMNMVYVASRVQPSRRRAKLSWSHHAEVAALERADQDDWLDRAEREQLSVRCLREAIRTQRRGDKPEPEAAADVAPSPAAASHSPDFVCPSCGRPLAPGDGV